MPGGSWQPCGAAEYAANATANGTTYEAGAESLCDALDNNCNSQTDENVTQACYIGPAGTSGVGICKPGVKTCSAGVFGSCVGQVLPAVETYTVNATTLVLTPPGGYSKTFAKL